MAIVNRDLDASQQRECHQLALGAMATGATRAIYVAASPVTIQHMKVAAQGVSNAMQVGFYVQRFIVGSGATFFAIGISNLVLASVGTSGPQGFSGLAAAGSTLLNLQAGDVLHANSSVANGNATDLALNIVLKRLQDVLSLNGVTS